jgi:hypothetical protein
MQDVIAMGVERIQIASEGPAEEHRFLRYDCDPRSEGVKPDFRDIHAVYRDLARR